MSEIELHLKVVNELWGKSYDAIYRGIVFEVDVEHRRGEWGLQIMPIPSDIEDVLIDLYGDLDQQRIESYPTEDDALAEAKRRIQRTLAVYFNEKP
jgi:hypothetical protein